MTWKVSKGRKTPTQQQQQLLFRNIYYVMKSGNILSWRLVMK